MTTTATPKIVGKALYLELVGNKDEYEEAQLRGMIGWQYGGTKQVLVFPEYQDDTGKVESAVVMTRVITAHSPRAQWDTTYTGRLMPRELNAEDTGHFASYKTYNRAEWDLLTEKEKHDSRQLAIKILLKNAMVDTYNSEPDSEGNRTSIAGQGWVVRDNKPISVEITDQDMDDLHKKQTTPQAVIRRINKVRGTLDKFPAKLV